MSWLFVAGVIGGGAVLSGVADAAPAAEVTAAEADQTAAISHLNDGATALKADQFKDALRYFTAAIESGDLSLEGMALAYHHRGIAHQKLGQTGPAIADYTKAIWQGSLPNDVLSRSYYNRGIAYAEMGEFERAEQDYSSAIELNPSYASAYHNRANLRRARGAYQEAIDDYSLALTHLDGAGRQLPLYGRALAKEALGDKQGAIADLRQTLQVQPDYQPAAAKLAELEPGAKPTLTQQALVQQTPAKQTLAAETGEAAKTGDMAKTETVEKADLAETDSPRTPRLWETIVTRFTAPTLRTAVNTAAPETTAKTASAPPPPSGHDELRTGEADENPEADESPDDDLMTGAIGPSADTAQLAGVSYAAEAPPAPATGAREPTGSEATGSAATETAAARDAKERPYRIQIGSFRSVQEAEKAWGRIGKPHAALVSGLQPYIAEADLGERGLFYRLQLGPFPEKGSAKTLCSALKERQVDCFIVRP